MREILFRGKRLDNGEWVYGFLVVKNDPILGTPYFFILVQRSNESFVIWYKVDPATVGQYTGLTDKNGVKIFEGDIVQDMCVYLTHLRYVKDGKETQDQADAYKHCGKIGVVRYNADGDIGSCGCCYTEFVGAGFLAHYVDLTQCQVLGNIYENPELLEV